MIATHLIKFFLEEEGDFSNAFSGFTTHPALWAFDGFTSGDTPEPPVVTPTPPTGAGKAKKRRRWQAEKEGKFYEFDNAQETQQFLQSLAIVKKKTFRLPDVELFYDDMEVTNLIVDNKPVLEWFYSDKPIVNLQKVLDDLDEDDIEVILLGL